MEDGKKEEENGSFGLANASSFLVGGLAQRAGMAAASKAFETAKGTVTGASIKGLIPYFDHLTPRRILLRFLESMTAWGQTGRACSILRHPDLYVPIMTFLSLSLVLAVRNSISTNVHSSSAALGSAFSSSIGVCVMLCTIRYVVLLLFSMPQDWTQSQPPSSSQSIGEEETPSLSSSTPGNLVTAISSTGYRMLALTLGVVIQFTFSLMGMNAVGVTLNLALVAGAAGVIAMEARRMAKGRLGPGLIVGLSFGLAALYLMMI
eukprot:TRINITY_DN11155_c0_g1_i1.p1 TRINITY_DN11155_c0_g1~~TRINITY_DN11155_c0_g1_i1.p1  ORF type:complete len:290 (+),score=73.31 TRINITY_DN11155_c0_g1_i1:82-870(+)